MKNRVIIVKGRGVAAKITLAQFERIDIDSVILATVLRYPQYIPHPIPLDDPTQILRRITEVADSFYVAEQEHLICSEYASIITERGIGTIKVVEGDSLTLCWLWNSVRNMHKNFGQKLVQITVDGNDLLINEIRHTLKDALEMLAPPDILG